jgi:predicted DNA-binding protein YlxM (UPF0122 family)
MGHLRCYPAITDSRKTVERRDVTELLQTRVHLLTGRDKTLLATYLEDGKSFRQIARLTGVRPTTIARRIRRILKRLTDETYLSCLANRDHFSDLEMAIVTDHLVQGLSMVRISRDRNLSYYRVREAVLKAQKFAMSIRAVAT